LEQSCPGVEQCHAKHPLRIAKRMVKDNEVNDLWTMLFFFLCIHSAERKQVQTTQMNCQNALLRIIYRELYPLVDHSWRMEMGEVRVSLKTEIHFGIKED
jgi:hypothetical protein